MSQASSRASTEPDSPCHVVAVIGGATAGAEVAGRLAERGAQVVVFEMNPRPYGKIEDGLPRWHVHLRHKEYDTIREKLGREGVHFVPNTKIGQDISVEELFEEWGFSGIVLANGAWRDRGLPIEGADDYFDKGLIYQNPFIIAFNHGPEASYDGPTFESLEGALVVGGGLASIDVVKVLMLELTCKKLAERGIDQDLVELEVKGIPKILAGHGIEWDELAIEPCTLFYRRRVEDMPLMDAPPGADEARIKKVEAGRQRMLAKAQDKYKFRMEPLCSPTGLIVENDRLVGLEFVRNEMVDGRPKATSETFERRGSCVISSIGSIPESIDGIPMKGELFAFEDWDYGRIDGFPKLFSVGNVVTGKGNIVASRKHAAEVSLLAVERFLGLDDEAGHAGEEKILKGVEEAVAARAAEIVASIEKQEKLSPETANQILDRVRARQEAIGYAGDFSSWIEKVTPDDMP